jgi:hypothetical protein
MIATDRTPSQALVDPYAVLASLAERRAVFHSEADFQFAFAWEAKLLSPGLEVRLETHPEPGVRLDVELIDPESGCGVAVELKYMTRLWAGAYGGESFALKNHGASDLRAYDVIKDIARVERFVGERSGWAGFVIAMTNEAAYWRPPTHGRATNADAFRLFEGNVLAGERRWGPNTGGTSRGRETPLTLRGTYELRWSEFSRVDSSPAGTFRALVVPIGGAT